MNPITGEVATMMYNLQTYSGSSKNNTILEQLEFGWRIFDVKDGQVRLISDDDTYESSLVYLGRI